MLVGPTVAGMKKMSLACKGWLMTWAEFEEKEFETAAIVEISMGALGFVWSPGQVLEKILGFDLASNPGSDHLLWRVLGAPRPESVRLVPAHWPEIRRPEADQLPRSFVSVVLQFKRPEYLRAPQAKQWGLWGRPYYRFTRSAAQHRTLRSLEGKLGHNALVRYASPAFWRRSDLESAHLRRSVVERTGFVSPRQLGAHRVWTYRRAGSAGRANPSGAELPFFDARQMQVLIGDRLRGAVGEVATGVEINAAENALDSHLLMVGNAAESRNPRARMVADRWVRELDRAEIDVPDDRIAVLRAFAAMSAVVGSVGARWVVSPGE